MRALTRSEQTRLRASGLPALGVALVLACAFLLGLLAATRARVGDLLFAARPVQAAHPPPDDWDGVFVSESK